MARRPISDEEASAARDVLFRKYRQWVEATAQDLAEDIIRGETEDAEALYDQLHETIDSAMTYNADQALVLFASESTSEGAQQVEDMGGGGDNYIATLAFCTFEIDVRDALDRIGLGRDFDRDEFVIEAAAGDHGEELVDAATKVLMTRVTELIESDSSLAVAWDEHSEKGGSAADFLAEHE